MEEKEAEPFSFRGKKEGGGGGKRSPGEEVELTERKSGWSPLYRLSRSGKAVSASKRSFWGRRRGARRWNAYSADRAPR